MSNSYNRRMIYIPHKKRLFYLLVAGVLAYGLWQVSRPIPYAKPVQGQLQPPQKRLDADIETVLENMDSAERDYYLQMFDFALQNVRPDERYPWDSYKTSGAFQAGRPFISKSNAICRDFREVILFKRSGAGVYGEGTACKRVGRSGWCKLPRGAMLSCALEAPDNIVDETLRDVGDLIDQGEYKAKIAGEDVEYWFNDKLDRVERGYDRTERKVKRQSQEMWWQFWR